MTPEMLQRFAYRGDRDPELHHPWTDGGKSYATNRAILIETDAAVAGIAAVAAHKTTAIAKELMERNFAALNGGALAALPDLPPAKACEFCKGGAVMDCPTCAAGTYPDNPEEGCPTCNDTGQVSLTDGDSAIDCWFCDGLGLDRQEVVIGDVPFDDRLLRLIAALPGARFALHSTLPETEPSAFVFTGGRGLVMPMRKRPA